MRYLTKIRVVDVRFFRVFVCESKKVKAPIYNGYSYPGSRTYPKGKKTEHTT